MGSEEDSTRESTRVYVARKMREEAAQTRAWSKDPRCFTVKESTELADEEERAARLIEADPSQIIAAIRVFTVDMPDDAPNGEAERQLKRLGDALADDDLDMAGDAYVKMNLADADRLKALRETAAAYFGGDFGKETK